MALLTAEDVLNKKFQVVKFREGYDQVEVDEFLDEVVATVYALQVENGELKEQLEAANRRIAELSEGAPAHTAETVVIAEAVQEEPPVVVEPEPVVSAPIPVAAAPDEAASAASMLALAQRLHDEYVGDGREEGERIIEDARNQGDAIIQEAEKNRDEILHRLDGERSELESKINSLREFEAGYRTSLTDHLQKLLSEVDASN